MEVMAASLILSVFVLGIGGLWRASSNRVEDLLVKQKAVFVLNAEMERLSALYAYTDFGAGGSETSYLWGTANGLPDERSTYPNSLSTYVGGSDNYVTTSANQFANNDFRVWIDTSFFGLWDRAYVWIDRDRNIAGRLSWIQDEIDDERCRAFGGYSPPNWSYCRTLDLYLEYPYRRQSNGEMQAPETLRAMSVSTIAGRL